MAALSPLNAAAFDLYDLNRYLCGNFKAVDPYLEEEARSQEPS